jgi:hypothetical protein
MLFLWLENVPKFQRLFARLQGRSLSLSARHFFAGTEAQSGSGHATSAFDY